jgi:hypothetical protein
MFDIIALPCFVKLMIAENINFGGRETTLGCNYTHTKLFTNSSGFA